MKATKTLRIALASMMGVAVLTACQDEELTKTTTSHTIKVTLCPQDTNGVAAAPARELTRTMVITDDSLLMHELVSDNLTQPLALMADQADTRATVVTTENIGTAYGEFGMEGFIDNYTAIPTAELGDFNLTATGQDQYISGGKCTYSSATRSWTLANSSSIPYAWHLGYQYTFWSYAPKTHAGTFAYGSAGSRGTMTITGYANPIAAKNQKDLLVAYNNRVFGTVNSTTNNDETVNIAFRHALAVIKFDVTALYANYAVDKVEIVNAYSQGNCAVKGSDLADTDVTKAFTWTNQGTKKTFEMTSGFDAGTDPDHFFMIPQTLPTDAKIKLTVTKIGESTPVTWETTMAATWLPGKVYEYKLTYVPAIYSFSLTVSGSGTQKFTNKNTTGDVDKYVKITSTRQPQSATTPTAWNYWDITGYQIGNGTEQEVEISKTSITVEGLEVSEDLANGQLKIVSKKWESEDWGGHNYWTNYNSVSGDTEGTGWSPQSWSTTYTAANPLDLSKFNFQTENTTAMNTANCYIVRHAGTYKIPLVYGNGVQDGVAASGNNESYKFTASGNMSNTNNFLGTFKNHRNESITSPFIENNTSCTAGSVEVLWQDKGQVIKNVQLVGNTQTTGNYNAGNVRYIQFEVDEDKICQNNAVIVVKDNTTSKNIMWSWHIWTTNDPRLLSDAISVTNYTNDTYEFFPLNLLGWIEPVSYHDREEVTITLTQKVSGKKVTVTVNQTTPTKAASTGVMYQWGRKDPTPASNTIASGSTNFKKTTITSGVTLGKAIQSPGTFYLRTDNWCSSLYVNLWSGSLNSATSVNSNYIPTGNTTTKKTIYDPSPVGYKVPSIYAYSGFSLNSGSNQTYNATSVTYINKTGDWNCGWYFNRKGKNTTGSSPAGTIFFPGAGWRENNPSATWVTPGEVTYTNNSDGNYHSAMYYGYISSTGKYNMSYFAFGTNKIELPNNQFQTLGASVRPVKE